MNEEPTKDLPDRGSFEARVFARFDLIDARFETVDARLETLESRGFDTKPIWESALKAIMEMGLEVSEVKRKIAVIETDVAGMRIDYVGLKAGVTGVKTDVTGLKTDVASMKTDYAGLRNDLAEMKRELKHHIDQKLDLILKFFLEDREHIRDANERIKQLETKLA